MRCLKTGRLFSRQDRKDQGSGHCLAPGGWEDLGCVMIIFTWLPLRLCNILMFPLPHALPPQAVSWQSIFSSTTFIL